MAKEVIMPKFGFTQESSEIARWLKQPGDAVDQGDPIVEVTTDKVNMEIEAPVTGILDGVRFKQGDVVPVTEIIAYIRSAGEPPMVAAPGAGPAASAPPPVSAAPREPATAGRVTPVAAQIAQAQGLDPSTIPGTGPGGRVTKQDIEQYLAANQAPAPDGTVRATPAARRVGREQGIDLAQVHGTGPRGRVQSADVEALAARSAAVTVPFVAPVGGNILQTILMAGMRQTIATRLQKSAQEAPHVYFDADINVSAAEALRQRVNARLAPGQPRVSLTAILAKTCAWALKRNPLVNSRLDGNRILVLGDIHIGIAVALDQGLIVPVVHSVDQKGITLIAAEIADLAERARNNRLCPEDVMDGTFTISNLGMFGVDRFTAIINPPQVAILAVGRVSKRFVPDEQGQPVARPMMTVTLSADHRVVDGAVAAHTLSDLREALEHPELLAV